MMGASLYIRGTRVPLVSIITSLALLVILTLLRSAPASAATFTWTGGGGDANFSTDANWQGGTAPTGVVTDVLIFDNTTADYDAKTPNNNLTGATFFSFIFQGADADYPAVEGNDLSLESGIIANASGAISNNITLSANNTWTVASGEYLSIYSATAQTVSMTDKDMTMNGNGGVSISADISGSGAIIVENEQLNLGGNNTYTGQTTVAAGSEVYVRSNNALGATSANTVIADGATIRVKPTDGLTLAEPISIGGSGTTLASAAITVEGYGAGGGGGAADAVSVSLTGAITLTSNTLVKANSSARTITMPSVTKGGFTITRPAGDAGTVVVNGESLTSASATTTINANDSQPGVSLSVLENNVVILLGVRGDTFVEGLLKGTGTTGDLYVYSTGVVAPGLSPGCITSGNVNIDGGRYEMEIGGKTPCSGHDQQIVNGTLTIGANSLMIPSLVNGYKPVNNDTFVLFSNDGTDPVVGAFTGGAEGSTGTVDGVTFRITYKGGDGNDVAITVIGVPGTPDTGSPLMQINPAIPALSASIAVGGLLLAKKRLAQRKYINR